MPGDKVFEDSNDLLNRIYTPEMLLKKSRYMPRKYLSYCIVVFKDGIPLARIALYDNPHLEQKDDTILIAGGFESIDDTAVVAYLFSIVEAKARQLGKKTIIGPMNGSTWEDHRFCISVSRNIFFTEPVYPDYYSRLWIQCGFNIFNRYYSAAAMINSSKGDQLHSSINIRHIDQDNFEEELKGIYRLSMRAFEANILFSPIDEPAFVNKYLAVKKYIDKDLVLIAESSITREVIAFVFALPDVFDLPGNTAIIKTIAKDPAVDAKGLVIAMLSELHRIAFQKGYKRMIHAFMHEDNRSRKLSALFYGQTIREYALFSKPVSNGNS
jgi:hypothetical protein